MSEQGMMEKLATLATMPRLPSIDTFQVKKWSSMAKLQKEFNAVGLPFFSGRAHVYACTPTKQQEVALKSRGLDVAAQRFFSCSPRKG